MAAWAGGDDRVVGTTTTTTLLRGNMIPVSVYHSAFWFCRPVSRVYGALYLLYRRRVKWARRERIALIVR